MMEIILNLARYIFFILSLKDFLCIYLNKNFFTL